MSDNLAKFMRNQGNTVDDKKVKETKETKAATAAE